MKKTLKNNGLQLALALTLGLGLAPAQATTQVVYLDFTSGTDGGGLVYTPGMVTAITDLMSGHYTAFDYSFVTTAPGAGDFSTIKFNSGGPGGLAEGIDFLNLNRNDNAVVNMAGLGLVSEADIVSASAIIGAHELGHIQGLRHGNSWGPIGTGPAPVNAGAGLPTFPMPAGSTEHEQHVMASPGAVGSSFPGSVITPSWFGERSAIKLTNNACIEAGPCAVQGEGALALDTLAVPNTLGAGATNEGKILTAKTFTAFGTHLADTSGGHPPGTVGPTTNIFTFEGLAEEIWNFELMSDAVSSILDSLDTLISVIGPGGSLIDYYGSDSWNDDEFETFDSWLIDLILPADGLYTILVDASGFVPSDSGDFYLWGYNLSAETGPTVPLPAPLTLMLLGLLLMGSTRGRKKRA